LLHIVLVEPEIPQNTGNIARTCAVIGASLHLIRPLGFELTEKWVRRAGLDYWDKVSVTEYDNLDAFFTLHPEAEQELWLATTKAPHCYTDVHYTSDCWLFFGKETAGLPEPLLLRFRERCVRIPMRGEVRCLNLSNSVAVLVYEALRQNGFPGLTGVGAMGGNPTP
jgi:tRNA (cytidine/uridine-2'-O-)-methyltransferase